MWFSDVKVLVVNNFEYFINAVTFLQTPKYSNKLFDVSQFKLMGYNVQFI